jgi:hypothetical protein
MEAGSGSRPVHFSQTVAYGYRVAISHRGQIPWRRPRPRKRKQLNYLAGAPETIRTSDLCLRRAALYPTELRVPAATSRRAARHAQAVGPAARQARLRQSRKTSRLDQPRARRGWDRAGKHPAWTSRSPRAPRRRTLTGSPASAFRGRPSAPRPRRGRIGSTPPRGSRRRARPRRACPRPARRSAQSAC